MTDCLNKTCGLQNKIHWYNFQTCIPQHCFCVTYCTSIENQCAVKCWTKDVKAMEKKI